METKKRVEARFQAFADDVQPVLTTGAGKAIETIKKMDSDKLSETATEKSGSLINSAADRAKRFLNATKMVVTNKSKHAIREPWFSRKSDYDVQTRKFCSIRSRSGILRSERGRLSPVLPELAFQQSPSQRLPMLQESTDALNLAKQNLRKRKFNAAIEILNDAVQSDPREASLHEAMATAYYLRGDLEDALASFQEVTKLKPTLAKAWINVGAVLNRLGRYREATQALRKGAQRDKRSAQAQYNLGIAQKGMHQLAMAATAYKAAIRIDPAMVEAHQNLANIYLEMNNHRQAINSFRKALELRPGFERARKGLALAENAVAEAKKVDNPFGRLVSTEDLAKQKSEATFRELNEEERYEDRQTIRSHTGLIREDAAELAEFLRDQVEPTLLALSRVMSANTGADPTKLFEEFEVSCVAAAQINAQMKEKMALFEKHDSDIRK